MSNGQLIAERFRIEKIIGRGGNGNVYRGVDLETGQAVAIKALKLDAMSEEPTLLARFMQEADLLRQLNHPNIVKIIAAVEQNNEHFLVMDYIEGGSLRDMLAETPRLPVERVLQIGLDIADALARTHRLKIIHRDIKPSNILIHNDGTPFLTDFGVARMEDSNIITKTGDLIGTSAYLSPEVLTGETADTRSDIWSFGVVLYEMLAGRRPFDEEQQVAILVSILNKPVPNLSTLRPDAPLALVNLIYQMLEKDREKRISSVRVVGAELEAIMTGLDTSVHKVPPPAVIPGGVSRFPTSTHTMIHRPVTEEEKAILNFKRRVGCIIVIVLALLTLLLMLMALATFSEVETAPNNELQKTMFVAYVFSTRGNMILSRQHAKTPAITPWRAIDHYRTISSADRPADSGNHIHRSRTKRHASISPALRSSHFDPASDCDSVCRGRGAAPADSGIF